MYSCKKFENTFILDINNGEEITAALNKFCEDHKIWAGSIIGLGAVKEATLRFFDPETKRYVDKTFSEQMEICNLTGNISQMHGEVYLHLHITLGREDYSVIGGHLLSAVINGVGEFIVQKIDGNVNRIHNPSRGLNLYDFK